MSVALRAAGPDDGALIAAFVQELAEYEKLSHEAVGTAEDFAAALSGPNPRVFAVIAEADGEPAGFALWFYTFSTFTGRPGIYLEDLYVRPAFRRRGVARSLLTALARRCVAEGLGRFEWAALKWNAPAIAFYESLGAMAMDGWTVYRTHGQALKRLGSPVGRAGDEDETR